MAAELPQLSKQSQDTLAKIKAGNGLTSEEIRSIQSLSPPT